MQVMLALSAHLGSLEAEKQKLRAQVSISQTQTRDKISIFPALTICSPFIHRYVVCVRRTSG